MAEFMEDLEGVASVLIFEKFQANGFGHLVYSTKGVGQNVSVC